MNPAREFTLAIDHYVRETGMEALESGVETKPTTAAARSNSILELDLRSANITSAASWCTGYGFDFGWSSFRSSTIGARPCSIVA